MKIVQAFFIIVVAIILLLVVFSGADGGSIAYPSPYPEPGQQYGAAETVYLPIQAHEIVIIPIHYEHQFWNGDVYVGTISIAGSVAWDSGFVWCNTWAQPLFDGNDLIFVQYVNEAGYCANDPTLYKVVMQASAEVFFMGNIVDRHVVECVTLYTGKHTCFGYAEGPFDVEQGQP